MTRRLPLGLGALVAVVVAAVLPVGGASPVAGDQQWYRYPTNPVFVANTSGWDSAHVAHPSIIKDGAGYKMYYESYGVLAGGAIGLATSADGVHWTRYNANPILTGTPGAWDERQAISPTVLKEGSVYKMWYTSLSQAGNWRNFIGYATSTDGIHWTKHPTPVLGPGADWTWDEYGPVHASVVRDGGAYRMYYGSGSGTGGQSQGGIGLATSPDGVTWTRHPYNPLITRRAYGWDSNGVGNPSVLVLDGVYHMWYSDPWATGHATSANGVDWTRETAPIIQPTSGVESCKTVDPTVLADGPVLRMWYVIGCDDLGIAYAATAPFVDGTATPTSAVPGTPTATRTATATTVPGTLPFNGPWHRYSGNPAMRQMEGPDWQYTWLNSPSVIWDGGQYRMYYAGGGINASIGLATSANGVSWTRGEQPLLAPTTQDAWDWNMDTAPSVLKEGSGYKMWFAGGNDMNRAIGYATSPNGLVWTKYPQPVLTQSTADGASDRWYINNPVVIADPSAGGYRMYYNGGDGGAVYINMATSPDGIAWTKYAGNPVISPGQAGYAFSVTDPTVLLHNGVYHLWYTGNGGLNHVVSPDGAAWTPQGGVILESDNASYPAVLAKDSQLHMWYWLATSWAGMGYATTGEPPVPTPTQTRTPTLTFTPTRTYTATPIRDKIVYLPTILKLIPPPTPTPTVTPTPTPGWRDVIRTTFEGDFPGPWLVGDNNGPNYGEFYWAPSTCHAYQGSYSGWAIGGGAQGQIMNCGGDYAGNVSSWMVYGPFSLADTPFAELRLQAWLNSEPGYDGLCRMASVDGQRFYGSCSWGNSQGWVEQVLNLNNVPTLGNLAGRARVWVALAFISDNIGQYAEGAFVDNVTVRTCYAPGYMSCPLGAGASAPAPSAAGLSESEEMLERPPDIALPEP